MLPIADSAAHETSIHHQGCKTELPAYLRRTSSDVADCMLVRPRRSRIYFLKTFFDYPLKLSIKTLKGLGLTRVFLSGLTYIKTRMFPQKPELTLEDFLINRFGSTLYKLFFESYTRKVWGRPCSAISADWGAQRIKGLSISKAVLDALRKLFTKRAGLMQPNTEMSLIESFLYPKFGPGQMWEKCLERVTQMGGILIPQATVIQLLREEGRIQAVVYTQADGTEVELPGNLFFSTMPIKDLVLGITPSPVPEITIIARELPYRSFITIGLLVRTLKVYEEGSTPNVRIKDNWIYIQDPSVALGRLQVFNNWSPWLVQNQKDTVWLGLEYFCDEDDDLWRTGDPDLLELGIKELVQIGILNRGDVLDGTVCRVPKAYPAYFGSYANFPRLRAWLDTLENLFLIGRNGMHRYNNQDHSMLSAMLAVKLASMGSIDRSGLWAINVETEYHEEK